jgi:pheromone shutdown protein TraB
MITLIGVGHVFAISDNVKQVIRTRRPQVVCLELDPARYQSLLHRDEPRSVPIQYRLLSYLQTRMADKFDTQVGDEMLAAAEAAGEVGAKVALIDMDAGRVFRQLWKRMSLKEKANLFGGAFIGLFMSKARVEEEMDRYEGNEAQYIEAVGQGFPTIKKVLIDDRNEYMAGALRSLSAHHSSIVAVVGDGHVPGLIEQLKPLEAETVRLKDLRNGTVSSTSGSEVTTSFWYDS